MARDRGRNGREDKAAGWSFLFPSGGRAGRSPGRGDYRGFALWGRTSGGVGRDRPGSERTRRQSGRGRPR